MDLATLLIFDICSCFLYVLEKTQEYFIVKSSTIYLYFPSYCVSFQLCIRFYTHITQLLHFKSRWYRYNFKPNENITILVKSFCPKMYMKLRFILWNSTDICSNTSLLKVFIKFSLVHYSYFRNIICQNICRANFSIEK